MAARDAPGSVAPTASRTTESAARTPVSTHCSPDSGCPARPASTAPIPARPTRPAYILRGSEKGALVGALVMGRVLCAGGGRGRGPRKDRHLGRRAHFRVVGADRREADGVAKTG